MNLKVIFNIKLRSHPSSKHLVPQLSIPLWRSIRTEKTACGKDRAQFPQNDVARRGKRGEEKEESCLPGWGISSTFFEVSSCFPASSCPSSFLGQEREIQGGWGGGRTNLSSCILETLATAQNTKPSRGRLDGQAAWMDEARSSRPPDIRNACI